MVVKVPFSFEKMWENSGSKWSKFIEDIRKKGSVMNLKVKTGFIGEPHDLFENESYRFNEEWIDKRVNYFSMFISGMFFKNYLILDKKVRNIVIKVNIFRNCIKAN